MGFLLGGRRREIYFLAFRDCHDRFFPIGAHAAAAAEPAELAGDDHRADLLDFNLEHRLDGALDVGLRRVGSGLEEILVVLLLDARAALREEGPDQDFVKSLIGHRRTP